MTLSEKKALLEAVNTVQTHKGREFGVPLGKAGKDREQRQVRRGEPRNMRGVYALRPRGLIILPSKKEKP
jgi:hypothetical protein